jgi:hypothetical protein
MTIFALIVALGWPLAAYCAYQWWLADQDVAVLEMRVQHLVELQYQAHDAMRPRHGRRRGEPTPIDFQHVEDAVIDRLAADTGVRVIPERTLTVVSDTPTSREAHSHAEKGAAS